MTKHGNKISGVTVEQVRNQLAEETDPKAIKRLTAAREYLAGLSPAEIETKYGWHEQTVYGWLNRFEERGFEAALYDDKPPGREPELADDQFEEFAETLQDPPDKAGYDEPAWTSKLARQYLLEKFDIAYSLRHVQRLMKKAEVSWKKPRPEPSSADQDELEEYDEELEKKSGTETQTNWSHRSISFGKQWERTSRTRGFRSTRGRPWMCRPLVRGSTFSAHSQRPAKQCFWSAPDRSQRKSPFSFSKRYRTGLAENSSSFWTKVHTSQRTKSRNSWKRRRESYSISRQEWRSSIQQRSAGDS